MNQYMTEHKKPIISLLILIVVIILFLIFKTGKQNFEIHEIVISDFSKTVTASGRVLPSKEVNLSFEVSSRVTNVSANVGDEVRVGQILATLDNSEIQNMIQESRINLSAQIARLNKLDAGEELSSQLSNQRAQLYSTLNKAYVIADDVVRNKIDLLIKDPYSRFPSFDNSLVDYFLRQEINEKRYLVKLILDEWKIYHDQINSDNVTALNANYAIDKLNEIANLLDIISGGTTKFDPTPDINQAQIDSYVAGISNSRNLISSTILDVKRALESLQNLESEIPILQAGVQGADASISSLNTIANKYILKSPLSGIIAARNIEVGENSNIGQSVFSIMGDSGFEIEIFIPEILIDGVRPGNSGYAVLDAFGRNRKFNVFVSQIEPRETIKDGITTYKTVLNFVDYIENLRPGMTVEVVIIKEEIKDVILIPNHLISSDENINYVEIVTGKKGQTERREVVLGQTDGKGQTIVISGLELGEKILIPTK